jgi:hypothetical protein
MIKYGLSDSNGARYRNERIARNVRNIWTCVRLSDDPASVLVMDLMTIALQFLVAYGSLGLLIWAFVDAARFSSEDFKKVDKMGRGFWLTLMGAAIVLLIWLGGWRPDEPFGPRSITWIAGLAVIGIYFYDIRPRLKRAQIELRAEGDPARTTRRRRSRGSDR